MRSHGAIVNLMFDQGRRNLLQVGSIGGGLLTLPGWLRAAGEASGSTPQRNVLLLYMDGGPSHIDLFDLKPDAPAEIRGPWLPIKTTAPGVEIGELLPGLATQMHHVLLVRSVRHQQVVHDPAVYQMLTGYPHFSSAGGLKVEPTDLPHLASAFQCGARTASPMPAAIHLPDLMKMEGRVLPGQNGGILGATFDPFLVDVASEGPLKPPDFAPRGEMTASRLQARRRILDQFQVELSRYETLAQEGRFQDFQTQALSLLATPQIQAAFDLDSEPTAMQDRYGRHRHGRSVLLARRLIEAGARFVTVYWGREEQDWGDGVKNRFANNPWDTHRNHFPLLQQTLVPRADQTLSALLADLSDRGMLGETLVVWMGDFGRTPRISRPWASRDHWPDAFSILLAGGGTKAGTVFGRTDAHAAQVTEDPVSPADIASTILHHLGVDPHKQVQTPSGRKHQLSTGKVMSDWFT